MESVDVVKRDRTSWLSSVSVWGGIGGIAFLLKSTYAISTLSMNDGKNKEKIEEGVIDEGVTVPYCECAISREPLRPRMAMRYGCSRGSYYYALSAIVDKHVTRSYDDSLMQMSIEW